MSSVARNALCLIASICLIAACSDSPDEGDGPTDTGVDADVSDTAEMDADTSDTVSPPDGDAQSDTDGDAVGDTGPDTDGETDPPIGAGAVMNFAEVDPECCRDLTGDSNVDNTLGETLLAFSENFDDYELNSELQTALQENDIIHLFEFREWDDLAADESLTLISHPGRDATPEDASDDFVEDGSPYLIAPESYDSDGEPVASFNEVEVQDGNQLVATAEQMPFTVPLINSRHMTLTIKDVTLRATTSEPADLTSGGYVNLEQGELSGAVSKDEIFENVNDLASRVCSCLDGQELFTEESDDQWTCNDPPESCAGQSGVAYLCDPDACSTLVGPVLDNNADLNRNESAPNDHYSLGARFTAVGATIEGVAEEE